MNNNKENSSPFSSGSMVTMTCPKNTSLHGQSGFLIKNKSAVRKGRVNININGKTYAAKPMHVLPSSFLKNGHASFTIERLSDGMDLTSSAARMATYSLDSYDKVYKLYKRMIGLDSSNIPFMLAPKSLSKGEFYVTCKAPKNYVESIGAITFTESDLPAGQYYKSKKTNGTASTSTWMQLEAPNMDEYFTKAIVDTLQPGSVWTLVVRTTDQERKHYVDDTKRFDIAQAEIIRCLEGKTLETENKTLCFVDQKVLEPKFFKLVRKGYSFTSVPLETNVTVEDECRGLYKVCDMTLTNGKVQIADITDFKTCRHVETSPPCTVRGRMNGYYKITTEKNANDGLIECITVHSMTPSTKRAPLLGLPMFHLPK